MFWTPSYSETDLNNGGFGLTYNARTANATRAELGARFDRASLLDPSTVLALRGKLASAHDRVSDPMLNPVFEAVPGAAFIVNGATSAKNLTLASFGPELRYASGVARAAKLV
jgi:uncharacterized protein with beta-barrel porin domain